jgi:microcystin-dependent protein
MEQYIGQIMMFGGNFAPRSWALCNGQLLPISSYTALFSILGTTYGGDGRTTFALPDLRGRSPIHAGHGPGLSNVKLGQRGGQEYITLTVNNMPSHSHTATITGAQAAVTLKASVDEGSSDEAEGNILASGISKMYSAANVPDQVSLAPVAAPVTGSVTLSNTGNQQAFNNRNPFEVVNYIIALFGTYPSRS